MASGYAMAARTTVNRLRKRATYDYKTIHSIFDSTPVLHISFIPPNDPFPAILPMIGCTGSFSSPDDDPKTNPRDLYLHGYVSNRLAKLSKGGEEQGIPVCVAASAVDGFVLALSPFHNSYNYRSAVVHGFAHIVSDEAEKQYALQLITDSILPQRWENSRQPPTKTEMQSTSVLRIEVESASAKIRAAGPSEDRGDLKNAELRKQVWTGTIPSWIEYGDPVAADGNQADKVPEYIKKWVKEEKVHNKTIALEAIDEKKE